MAGRAEIEPQDKDSITNVLLFTGIDGREWEKAVNPLNKYSTVRKALAMQKMGPGYTFAKKMGKAFPDIKLGLVVNAKGGTSISEWMPGTELYNEAMKRVKLAMKYGKIKGIVWHQGESDVSKSQTYLQSLTTLIQAIRNELNTPDLPFIAGEVAEENPLRIAFNQILLHLPEKAKTTAVITAEGTATIDGTHFNSASQRLLGERYALEMIRLTKKR